MNHEKWLAHTVDMAVKNVESGGGPFASIVVKDGQIIGSGTNMVQSTYDPSAHAELLAIKEACAALKTVDLSDCVLYASGEPCPMCLGASYLANVGQIFYACSKKDAHDAVNFTDSIKDFFPDQQLPPEERKVPFIQKHVTDAIKPFIVWDQQQVK